MLKLGNFAHYVRLVNNLSHLLTKSELKLAVRCCALHTTCAKRSPEPNEEDELLSVSPLIEFQGSWPKHEYNNLLLHMRIMPNFLTEYEEGELMKEIEPHMKRLRYEYNHWDDAIHGFRETERKQWYPENRKILDRVSEIAFNGQAMPYVHVLDLAKEGVIKPHVDSTRYCGNIIAGLSLLSDCVMRLVRTDEVMYKQVPAGMGPGAGDYRRQPKAMQDVSYFANILLPRRSLYIMSDTARYNFTHEILANETSRFKRQHIQKARRVSIICRNNPVPLM